MTNLKQLQKVCKEVNEKMDTVSEEELKEMKINNVEVVGNKFAYEGCHKIYVIEDAEDEQEAIDCGYKILDISELVDTYRNSCELRFVRNWKLDKLYVGQYESATFEDNGNIFEFTNEYYEDDEWY